MTVQDDARIALDRLRRKGWWKDGQPLTATSECMITAQLRPSLRLDEATAAVIREQYPERLGHQRGPGYYVADVIAFNDHPDTTFDDVQAVLEKVASS
jgi:hypothetical protein